MKRLFVAFLLLLIAVSVPTAEYDQSEISRDSWEMVQRIRQQEDIQSYVQDVGVKYKYSSRAKDFLTEENLELIINNSKSYPSVIIAMAIIETGWGRYAIGNNYFGIKGKGHIKKTKEWVDNNYITITASFQQYKSKADNIKAVSELLHNSRYNLGAASNYKEAAFLVKKGGYATDPLYAYKINFIIEKYELYRLDKIKDNYKLS